MSEIAYIENELFIEQVPVKKIAEKFPTPFFVYGKNIILNNIRAWQRSLKNKNNLICFALKANDNLNIVSLLSAEGCGADIVSAGELFIALRAGIQPEKIVFAGVGKQEFEIEYALKEGILAFNVESRQELKLIQQIAGRMNKTAAIHLRLNPDIDAKSHPYISTGMAKNKFGIETSDTLELFKLAQTLPNISLKGIHAHIGSQLLDMSPFEACSRALRELYFNLQAEGYDLETIDLGGGLGVDYQQVIDWPLSEGELPVSIPTIEDYTSSILKHLKDLPLKFIFEPGRSMIANAGILAASVIYTKQTSQKNFVILNCGMNDLIRPALYQAYHRILPVNNPVREKKETVDVVGPVCESADLFARNLKLPALEQGELVAIFSCGAYGYSLSSNYNGRLRLAELLVDGAEFKVVRRGETYQDLLKLY